MTHSLLTIFYSGILLMLSLDSCTTADAVAGAEQLDSTQVASNGDTIERSIVPPNGFGCYYKFDDKYDDGESDEMRTWDWASAKRRSIAENGVRENLFDNNGGGPNGAEWNPAADLYFFALVHDTITPTNYELMLDSVKVKDAKFTSTAYELQFLTVVFFEIPYETWSAALRDMRDEEIETVCGENNALQDANDKVFRIDFRVHTLVPTLSGKVAKVQSFTEYFHCAFGE